MLDTRHRRRLDTARAFARLSPRRWRSAQPTSSRAPHCPHVIVVVVGQAVLARRGEAVLPAGKAPLRRSDGFEHRSPLLQRAPGRPTLPDGGAGGGGLHAAGAEVGDGGDARRGSRRASQLPRAAVSGAARRLVTTRHDRKYSLVISSLSCLVRLGFAQVLTSGRAGERGGGGGEGGATAALILCATADQRLRPLVSSPQPQVRRPAPPAHVTESAKCNMVCR